MWGTKFSNESVVFVSEKLLNWIKGENNMMLNDILNNWNITNEKIEQIYSTAWVVGDKYILKIGNNVEWLQNNIKVIRELSKCNIPVATIIKTGDGLDYIIDDNKYYFLSEKIKGEHIEDIFSDDYIKQSYDIGEIIAKLHSAFKHCQNQIDCNDNDFYKEITGWVMDTYKNKGITSVPDEILVESITELESNYPKLERQLIHRDIHLGNMLFENDELTGYIDFDLSQINARIFDICYTALGFLIGITNDNKKTEKWLQILQQLVRGYDSLIPLTDIEKSAIWNMMIVIEILFVAYFTNQNDLECANGASEMLGWLWDNKDRISF